MKLRSFIPGLQDLILLLGAWSLTAKQMIGFADDPGVGWHLLTGRYVLEHGTPPAIDPFLAAPRAWISDQWLSDAVLAKLFELGSWPYVYAALTAIYLIGYFGLLYPALRRLTGGAILSSVAVLAAFKIGQIHFILRPAMFGFLLFTIIFVIWTRACRVLIGAQQGTLKSVLLVPPLFWLWANLHPSFLLGIAYMVVALVGLLLDRLVRRDAVTLAPGRVVLLLVTVLIAFAATGFNPYGLDLHRSIFSLAGSTYFMNLHMEWLGINVRSAEGQLFEFLLGVTIVAQALRGERAGWRLYALLPLLMFAHLALQAVRIAPYFAVAASYPFVEAVRGLASSRFISESPTLAWLTARFAALDERERDCAGGRVALIAILAVLAVRVHAGAGVLWYQGPWGPSAKFPHAAIAAITQEAKTEGVPLVVAAAPEWGGVIAFDGGGMLKPVIDDRNTLLGERAYRALYEQFRPAGEWQGYLEKAGATRILLKEGSDMAKFLKDRGLEVSYEDASAAVFVYPPRVAAPSLPERSESVGSN